MVVLVAALALLPIALIVSAEQGHHYGNPGHTRSNIPRTLLNPRVDVHGLFLNTDGVNGTAPFTSLEKRQCAGPTCSGTCCVADATCCASTIICCKPTYFCFAQVCCLKTTQIGCGTGCIPTGGDCCNSNGDWCDPGWLCNPGKVFGDPDLCSASAAITSQSIASVASVSNVAIGSASQVVASVEASLSAQSVASLASIANQNNQGPSQTQTTIFVNGPSNTPLGTISNKKSTPIGAIVGGVVGGIAVIAALAIGLFFFCRRKPSQAPLGSPNAFEDKMAVAGAASGVAAVPYQDPNHSQQYTGSTYAQVPNPQGPTFPGQPQPPPMGYPEPYTYGAGAPTPPITPFNNYNQPPPPMSPPPGSMNAPSTLSHPMYPEPMGENEATGSPYAGYQAYDSSNRVSSNIEYAGRR